MGWRLVAAVGVGAMALAGALQVTGYDPLPVVVVGTVLTAGLWWSDSESEDDANPVAEAVSDAEPDDELGYCPRCGAMERTGRSTCRFCDAEL